MTLTSRQRMMMTFTFFSMFFGAGNLIFPPFIGAQAGTATLPAMIGFIVSAVGLPILGVLAVSSAGGFDTLAGRVHPGFAACLGLAIILTIGPCFAIPRTATTSFEMMVAPFVDGSAKGPAQLVYSAVFFAIAFLFAQRPDKLSQVLGRFLGPLLLILIAALFAACLVHGVDASQVPMGDYADSQMARGFLDGYQTMDLLAALYFGIVISANVRSLGVENDAAVRRETSLAGLGTGALLVVIYGALGYVGVVSGALARIDPASQTGATVLTNLTSALFGTAGTAFLGVVFVIACMSVCTGLICTCATYFHTRFRTVAGHGVTYRAWQMLFTVFSFVVSNAGLSMIIKVSVPVLSALYPVSIVLVLLAFAHPLLRGRFVLVHPWTVACVGVVAFGDCLVKLAAVFSLSLPVLPGLMGLLPLHDQQLGWLLPACVGLAAGVFHSLLRGPHCGRGAVQR